LIVPQGTPLHPAPATFHIAAVFEFLITDAMKRSVIHVRAEALVGLTVTAIAEAIVTLAEADVVGSATLVVISLTLAGERETVGAK